MFIHLKDFLNSEAVNEYFDLLFKNQIIPIDLTKAVNLKSFAKVLQSFSRAKTLDINKSRSLQDFLFEDNDDIKATFETKKETLNEHIRDFHKSHQDIEILKQKQGKLEHLKGTNATYETAKQEYLSKNVHLLFNTFKADEKAFTDNETKLNKAVDDFKIHKEEYDVQCKDTLIDTIEVLGANADFSTSVSTICKGESITFNYRVVVKSGELTDAELDKLTADFAK